MSQYLRKKRFLILVLVLVSSLLLFGCSDDQSGVDSYQVSGKVINSGTGRGMSGVKIYFEGSNLAKPKTTGSNGTWSATLKSRDVTVKPKLPEKKAKKGRIFVPKSKTVSEETKDIRFKWNWKDNYSHVVILYTNDEHGTIKHFDEIAWKKDQLAEKHDDVLLVSAGDAFSGNPVVDWYYKDKKKNKIPGKPMVDLMNAVGYDAAAIGNHEFDYGQKRLQESINNSEFPRLLANIKVDPGKADIKQPKTSTILKAYFKTETGTKNLDLALLSLIQVDDKYPSTLPANLKGLTFSKPLETASEYNYLADKSDLFIGLTHLGYAQDQKLAEELGVLDFIIGGHSHDEKISPVNGVLVTQAGENTKKLGKITLTINNKKERVVDSQVELLDTKKIEGSNRKIAGMIDRFNREMDPFLSEELGELNKPIWGNENLGCLMTDAVVKGPVLADENIDFSFQNSGGIRLDSLDKGSVTRGDIFELEPFGNNIIIYKMKSEDIKSLIKYSYQDEGGIDLRAGGLSYTVVLDDKGDVEKIKLTSEPGGKLNKCESYTVGLNQYIASTYEFSFEEKVKTTKVKHNQAIIKYVDQISDKELTETYQDLDRTKVKGGKALAELETALKTYNKAEESVSAGNLIADAVRKELSVDIGTYSSEDLKRNAEVGSGKIYSNILNNIYGSFRYDNKLKIAEIKGKNIEKMLKSQAKYYNNKEGVGPVYTQISGAEYTIEIGTDGQVKDLKIYIDGTRIKQDKKYTIGVNEFRWGYYIDGISPIGEVKTTSRDEEKILIDYLKGKKIVTAQIKEDRISVK